jgi:heme exporter protein A
MSLPDTPLPPVLAARNLTVSRGGRQLFAGLSFEVPAGSVLLLRGANGAGKTSLLLALSGAIRVESGETVFPGDNAEAEPASRMHLLLVQNAVKPRLTVGENLAFWRVVNGPTGIAAGVALEQVGLGGLEAIEAGHLSTGQTRRLALARLLVSRRPIWLLDEPSTGLDTDGEALVREMIVSHCAGGGIAVVATHHDLGLEGRGIGVETVMFRAGATTLSGVPW